ncbi:hypothetical protein VRRI112168_03480 [Vreelandella rituensis]|uniref:Uncharacterized protein n=1 Tax=Vreelandella rituensis TaxID=2282306 RepID=A0A368UAQ7_9GAMM|nr:hypothetical protein [Halomonas rituensis]RCV93716.1 hypothetical protein DU506_00755 [Halomonas rituensis]
MATSEANRDEDQGSAVQYPMSTQSANDRPGPESTQGGGAHETQEQEREREEHNRREREEAAQSQEREDEAARAKRAQDRESAQANASQSAGPSAQRQGEPAAPQGPGGPGFVARVKRGARALRPGVNGLKYLAMFVIDAIATALRRLFGKITNQDLEQQRKEAQSTNAQLASDNKALHNEQSDLERDLQRKKDDFMEAKEKSRHAEILGAAESIKKAAEASAAQAKPGIGFTPSSETELMQRNDYADVEWKDLAWKSKLEGYLNGQVPAKELFSHRQLDAILDKNTITENGDFQYSGLTRESAEYAKERALELAERLTSGKPIASQDMSDALTCIAYLRLANEHRKGRGYNMIPKEDARKGVEQHAMQYCAFLRDSDLMPDGWPEDFSCELEEVVVEMLREQQAPANGQTSPIRAGISLGSTAHTDKKPNAETRALPPGENPKPGPNRPYPGLPGPT